MSDDPNDEANWSPALREAVAKLNAEDEKRRAASYGSRSSAVRAARAACKRVYGRSYEAFEGPDYFIHPAVIMGEDRYRFELTQQVKDEADRLGITITVKGHMRRD